MKLFPVTDLESAPIESQLIGALALREATNEIINWSGTLRVNEPTINGELSSDRPNRLNSRRIYFERWWWLREGKASRCGNEVAESSRMELLEA